MVSKILCSNCNKAYARYTKTDLKIEITKINQLKNKQ